MNQEHPEQGGYRLDPDENVEKNVKRGQILSGAPQVGKKNIQKSSNLTWDNDTLKCQFCDYTAKKKLDTLKQHVLNTHFKDKLDPFLPKTKPWNCPECDEDRKTRSNLLRHYAWAHNMFYKVATKEDILPRAKGQRIRDPMSPRPSIKTKRKRMDSSEYSDDEGNSTDLVVVVIVL